MRLAFIAFHPAFILLLITSQTFSLIASTGLPYVANDKIAFVLVLLYIFLNRPSLLKKEQHLLAFTLSISSVLFIFLLLRYLFIGIDINASSINHLLAMFETILFAIYYRYFSVSIIWRSLLVCLTVHLIFALIQSIFPFIGLSEFTGIFSNYPPRSGYTLSAAPGMAGSVIGLPRAYGLFHEASGLSVLVGLVALLCIMPTFKMILPHYKIIYSMIDFISSNRFLVFYGIFLSICGVILTFSLTGLLYFSVPLLVLTLFYFVRVFGLIYNTSFLNLLLLIVIILIPFIFYDQTVLFMIGSFTASARYDVTSSFLNSVPFMSDHQFFFGDAMLWADATWDFPTRTFQVWGLFGAIFNYLWYVVVLWPLTFPFSLAALAASLTNASLSASASLLMLSVAIYLNFSSPALTTIDS